MTPTAPRPVSSSGRGAGDLAAGVRALASVTSPRQVAAVRRRLGLGATPAEVVAALGRTTGPDGGSASPAARSRVRPDDPAEDRHLAPSEDALLVVGDGMPARLAETWPAGGPLWVWRRGDDDPAQPAVAVGVVGTRRPTADGIGLAESIGRGLAAAGVHVVSGFARGIDQAAHRGALDAGGRTTAVLGTGLDVDYPARSEALRARVVASGGLLTEHPHGEGVTHPSQFLARNRILAGLVDAVVVIEAGSRSGALNTASWAADLGRDVMVVPASPSSPAAAGSLALLRDGAIPVRGADDVLETLGLDRVPTSTVPDHPAEVPALPPAARTVLGVLGPVPATPSALATATGLSAREVLVAASCLEAAGLADRTARGIRATGGRVR